MPKRRIVILRLTVVEHLHFPQQVGISL